MRSGRSNARALVIAMLSCSVLAASCSLFTDLSGFSDGAAATALSDAEAGMDIDGGGVSPDSGAEGGTEAGPTARFCAGTKHALCADFDDGNLIDGWTKTQVDSVGSLSLTTTNPKSPPRSLVSLLPRTVATDPNRRATLDRVFPGAWPHVVVELDLLIEPPDWMTNDVNAAVVSVEFYSSNKNDGVYLAIGETYANLNNTFGQALAMNTWHHVKIDVDYPAGRVTGSAGPRTYAYSFTPLAAGNSPSLTVAVGVNGYNQPSPRFAVHYDNVTIDLP